MKNELKLEFMITTIVPRQPYSGQNREKGYFMAFNFKDGQYHLLKVEIGER